MNLAATDVSVDLSIVVFFFYLKVISGSNLLSLLGVIIIFKIHNHLSVFIFLRAQYVYLKNVYQSSACNVFCISIYSKLTDIENHNYFREG